MEDDLFGGLLFADEPPSPAPAPKPAKKAAKPKPEKTADDARRTTLVAELSSFSVPSPSSEQETAPNAKRDDVLPELTTNAAATSDPALASEEKAPAKPQGELEVPLPSDAPTSVSQNKRVFDAPPKAVPPPKPKPLHIPMEWPSVLAGTASIAVLENAIAKNRLAHGLLLHGDDFALLTQVALALADRLLNTAQANAYFPPAQHPDCFALRPSGASRQVSADDTRELIAKTQVSGSVSPHKVAILYECDRMNLAAANIFLKTLEEPPANTTLLLLTTQPYALLPTVRSRVLHFRFPVSGDSLAQAAGLPAWLIDYQAWLGQLYEGVNGKRGVADSIFTLYGLVARFDAILAAATAEAWETEKNALPEELDKEEQKAVEKRLANGIRQRIFAEIEHATRAFALPRLTAADKPSNAADTAAPTANASHTESRTGAALDEAAARIRRAHTSAISELEHSVGLLRLNLNHATALENFLLHSMRLWARR